MSLFREMEELIPLPNKTLEETTDTLYLLCQEEAYDDLTLLTNLPNAVSYLNYCLYCAAMIGNWELVDFLLNLPDGADNPCNGFIGACEGGHMPIIAKMILLGALDQTKIYSSIPHLRSKASLERVDFGSVYIYMDPDSQKLLTDSLILAGYNGHTEVVKLLVTLGGKEGAYESGVIQTLGGGHIKLAKWLSKQSEKMYAYAYANKKDRDWTWKAGIVLFFRNGHAKDLQTIVDVIPKLVNEDPVDAIPVIQGLNEGGYLTKNIYDTILRMTEKNNNIITLRKSDLALVQNYLNSGKKLGEYTVYDSFH